MCIYSNNKCMFVFIISPVPIAEPLTSELIDTPVFHNLAPRPIKYRVSVPIPSADRRVSVTYGGGSAVEVGAACAAQSRKGFIKCAAFAAWLQFWSVFWPNRCFYLSSSSQHHLLAWQQWSDEKQVLLFYTYAQGLTWWFVPGGGGLACRYGNNTVSQLHPPTWCSPCACWPLSPPHT